MAEPQFWSKKVAVIFPTIITVFMNRENEELNQLIQQLQKQMREVEEKASRATRVQSRSP